MAIRQKKLQVSIQLAKGSGTSQPNTFAESGTDTVTTSNLRTSARIQSSGTPSGAQATVEIFGMTQSLMNQLSTLGVSYNLVPRNTLTLSAGDDELGMATVFVGTITAAYARYDGSPSVPFHFECNAGLADSTAPVKPVSYTGSADVATIMGGFAQALKLRLENNGVDVKLRNPYFWGNLRVQVQQCAQAANINAEILPEGVLAIWPKGGARGNQSVAIVAPPPVGRMIGYPTFTQNGLIVKNLFDPRITFGSLLQIQSLVLSGAQESISANVSATLPGDGQWAVYKLDHALDSLVPKGLWESTIHVYNPKHPQPVVPGPRG